MLTQPIQAGVVDYPDEVSLKVVLDAIASNVSENYGNGQRLTIEADPGSFQKAGLNSLADVKVRQLKLPPMSLAEALTATLSRIPNTKLKHIIKDEKIIIVAE
jgi:coproporphyrinogen III oxidase-like Fe-S oxidoreductase